jgi:hypothetical protein
MRIVKTKQGWTVCGVVTCLTLEGALDLIFGSVK